MSETSFHPYYLLRWDFSREQTIDRDVVHATHRLTDLPCFSAPGLQRLLRRIPADAFQVHATGDNAAHATQWQTCALGDATPEEIVDTASRGRLWIDAANIQRYDQQLAGIVDRLSRELMECHVGLRIIDPQADLILCSPQSQHYYGCDAVPSVLLHLRGRVRLWIYPNGKRFIDQRDHERIAQGRQFQRLYFEPAFDRHAQVYQIEPGQMISWPQPMPYRIQTTEGLSVCLRLKFQTSRSLRQNNVHLVNRWLRKLRLDRLCAHRIEGISASLKHVFASLLAHHAQNPGGREPEPTFVLDPSSPVGMRSLSEPFDPCNRASVPGITGINSNIFPISTSAVLEN